MGLEGFDSSFSPSFEPLTHCPFTHSRCSRYILLLPALLFELPGSHSSFFSPTGFSWCSHNSDSPTALLPHAGISKPLAGLLTSHSVTVFCSPAGAQTSSTLS